MNHILKFISYDGAYPNLCSGTLIMELDGKKIKFPQFCLQSGGSAGCDSSGEEYISYGPWTIGDFPKGFPKELEQEAENLVNENIKEGCCGGCI